MGSYLGRPQNTLPDDHGEASSSAIVVDQARGSHTLKIDGYSLAKEVLGNGQFIESVPFSVGGHSWVIRCYPNGGYQEYADYMSVYLMLDSDVDKDVKAKFSFHLLDKDGIPDPAHSCIRSLQTFSMKRLGMGATNFIKKDDLEKSVHLRDDGFTIRCDVIVMKEIRSEETKSQQLVVVPPSNLHQHLGDLLKDTEMDGKDVTFEVGGETFSAHRCVLSARSSVFKAELFGPLKETTPIKIHDMEGEVFKLLLYFIYTDSLPEMAQEGGHEVHTSMALIQHLLVAADRYNIERLKLLCEKKLCMHMNSDMVATSLALAEQHSCNRLKEACFDFLSSPSNLNAMVYSDGYEHLLRSCPSVLKELITRLLPLKLKAAKKIMMALSYSHHQ